jgi:hypothetical protein
MMVGDKVERIEGHRFPGVVRAIFTTLAGDERVVVELTDKEKKGVLYTCKPSELYVVID